MDLLGWVVSWSARHHGRSSELEVNDVAPRSRLSRNISRHTSVPGFTMAAPMHGRILALSAITLSLAAAAAPAQADQTIGLGQAADADGVVTAWRVVSPTPKTVQLRSMQGAITTATSDPVSLVASP